MSKRVRTYETRKWCEDCRAKIFSWFREYDLQRKQGMQESRTEKEEMKQLQRMKVITEMTKNITSKGRTDANNIWWVSELLAAESKQAWLRPGWENTVWQWHNWLFEMKKGEEKRVVLERRDWSVI